MEPPPFAGSFNFYKSEFLRGNGRQIGAGEKSVGLYPESGFSDPFRSILRNENSRELSSIASDSRSPRARYPVLGPAMCLESQMKYQTVNPSPDLWHNHIFGDIEFGDLGSLVPP